jgi:flagellin
MPSLRTNLPSLDAQRRSALNALDLARTTQRLASGLRINSAEDDPAGVGLVEQLTTEVRGDAAATQNIQFAVSAIQVADDGLHQIDDVLQRMRELGVQANNTALSASDSATLDAEYQSLITAIDDIAAGATFNGNGLLDNTFPNAGVLTLQSGAHQGQSSSVSFATSYLSGPLTVAGTSLLPAPAGDPATAQNAVDAAISTVTQGRARLGAKLAELDALKSNLDEASVANQDARSRIRDADVAAEVSNLVREQLLAQTGASALSSANLAPSTVLSLLGK